MERFLMCCGQYTNDLYRQNLVNEGLIDLQKFVLHQLDEVKNSQAGTEAEVKKRMPKDIIKLKIKQELILGHTKYDTKCWCDDKTTKSPLPLLKKLQKIEKSHSATFTEKMHKPISDGSTNSYVFDADEVELKMAEVAELLDKD